MYAHYGLLVIGIVAIGVGLFMIGNLDAMWRFTQWRNRAGGLQSERTPAWERWTRVAGLAVLLCGGGALLGFWTFHGIVAEEEARRSKSVETLGGAAE